MKKEVGPKINSHEIIQKEAYLVTYISLHMKTVHILRSKYLMLFMIDKLS